MPWAGSRAARLYNIARGSYINYNVGSRGAKCQSSGEDESDEATAEHILPSAL